mmetsp:Transcript_46489/g.122056  ORF Transcript_46489/g.122056 Transcript_46489/m.122056 type:complete len:242 (-) Transcript_46489:172-897(-)|eukprot:CAMPEP_0115835450 /NCGR_PEP_ID=MMETSP0287-20121206/4200_1 /TAXON_ID=412157 /ORGANISM="Chrysochromulina rotalis, Strain UIO044" /LENGTH=241 /DNA_ID=CAMNT_0003288907 /DNA_START=551 /DNA_END=1276 /DNA_ORIENTATION=+
MTAGDGRAAAYALEHNVARGHDVHDRDLVVRVVSSNPLEFRPVPLTVAKRAVHPDVPPVAQRILLSDLEQVTGFSPGVKSGAEGIASQVSTPLRQRALKYVRVEDLHALQRQDACLDQVLERVALPRSHRASGEHDPRGSPTAFDALESIVKEDILDRLAAEAVHAMVPPVKQVTNLAVFANVGRARILELDMRRLRVVKRVLQFVLSTMWTTAQSLAYVGLALCPGKGHALVWVPVITRI